MNGITKRHTLEIEGATYHLDEVADSDVLFDRLLALDPGHEHVRDERIPYWAELWPSAIALARHVAVSPRIRNGAALIEIGCGTGLPGIVAGSRGARITFTDYIEEALELAEHNWKLNHAGKAAFVRLDWRTPPALEPADVLLASDVAYEQRAFQPLLDCFDSLLKPGGTLLFSEPGRMYLQDFFAGLEQRGYRLERHTEAVFLRGVRTAVGVYEIRKKAA